MRRNIIMCKKSFLLISLVLVLALASITYGDYVISNFEDPNDPNDGWAKDDPNNPNITLSLSQIGADGNSLKIADTTGGGAERAITYSLVANNEVNEFREHTKVSLDVTRLADEWGGQWGGWNEPHTAFTGYCEFHMIIEAGRDVNDADGPPWSGGWNLLSQRANWGSWNGDDPINFTYDYSTLLNQIDFNNLGYLGFVLQTNWGNYAIGTGGIYYLDNVQLVDEGMAYSPNPVDHTPDMEMDPNLSWTPGAYADTHDVYFGTSFNDVNDANRASHPGLLCYSEGQEPNYYDPGTLELYTTYYWRIDEVNGLDICKGEVWDFMTAYSGMGVVIGDWENGTNGWKATWQGDTTFSYSTKGGTVTLGNYSLGVQTVKLADEDPGYWIIKRDGVLDLTDMKLQVDVTLLASEWNNEEVIVESLVVQSDLPHTWSAYTPTAIDRNTGEPVSSFFMTWKSARGNAYRTYTFDFSDYSDWADASEMTILLALLNGTQGLGNFYLDNARLLNVHLAGNLLPAHLQGNVKKTPTLKWTAGKDATTHDVYLGTDETAVTNATRGDPQGVLKSEGQTELTYAPGLLEKDKTYYWRIDEWGATGSPWIGAIWSFTTAEFEVVDDFEDYNDVNIISDTWIKGGGGTVGYPNYNYSEITIIHEGLQSMPFDYNNIPSPYYSEACAVTVGPNSLVDFNDDWTAFGVKSLELWVRGWPATVGSFTGSDPYTITASGEDIWDVPDLRGTGYHDEFHYAYEKVTAAASGIPPLPGSGAPTINNGVRIVAKVESVGPTDPWAKAGVMIRYSLDPNSTHGFMCITPDPCNGAFFEYRLAKGGLSGPDTGGNVPDINAPYWVALDLDIDYGTIKAYRSPDNSTWTYIEFAHSFDPPMEDLPVYVGLAVTAHNTAATCTAEFSNVTITAGAAGTWKNQDIGIKSNVAAPLYVTLQDDGSVGGDTATVTHTDPNIVLQNTWQAWDIALNDFEVNNPSLNLEKIKKITLGVGPADPCGTGTLYFDDIRLYPPRCMPGRTPDFDGDDCFVDCNDLRVLADNWLSSPADPNIDLSKDGKINFEEFAILASEWFEAALWPYY